MDDRFGVPLFQETTISWGFSGIYIQWEHPLCGCEGRLTADPVDVGAEVAIQNIIDQTSPASEALSGLNGGNYTGDRDPPRPQKRPQKPRVNHAGSQHFSTVLFGVFKMWQVTFHSISAYSWHTKRKISDASFRQGILWDPVGSCGYFGHETTKTRSADLYQDGLLLRRLGLLSWAMLGICLHESTRCHPLLSRPNSLVNGWWYCGCSSLPIFSRSSNTAQVFRPIWIRTTTPPTTQSPTWWRTTAEIHSRSSSQNGHMSPGDIAIPLKGSREHTFPNVCRWSLSKFLMSGNSVSHLLDLLIFPQSHQSTLQILRRSEMTDKYKARTIWCHTTDPEVRWQDRAHGQLSSQIGETPFLVGYNWHNHMVCLKKTDNS